MKFHQLWHFHGVVVTPSYWHLSFKVTTECDCCVVSVLLHLVPANCGGLSINRAPALPPQVSSYF